MRPNKALHPTAYSLARRASSLRFRRRLSLAVRLVRAAYSHPPQIEIQYSMMKNEAQNPITFRYPVWRDVQYLITARTGAILCGLMALLLIFATPYDAEQKVALCISIIVFIGLAILLEHLNTILNGYVVISESQITRFFGNGSNISLAWHDVEIKQVKSISKHSKRLKLLSKSDKRQIVIGNDIENYEQLQQIIEARLR